MTGKPQDPIPKTARRAADAGPVPDADALFEQLQGRLSEQPKRARLAELPTPYRVGLAVGLSGLVTAAAIKPLTASSEPTHLVMCAVYAGTALWLMLAALRPFQRPLISAGRAWLRMAVAVAAVVGLSVLPSLLKAEVITAPAAAALACLSVGTAFGLPVFVILRLLDRGQRLGPWLSALAAGVVGNLALQVHCPADDAPHRLLGHALILGVLMLLAAVAFAVARAGRSNEG